MELEDRKEIEELEKKLNENQPQTSKKSSKKLELKKMVIYHEIMSPKFEE